MLQSHKYQTVMIKYVEKCQALKRFSISHNHEFKWSLVFYNPLFVITDVINYYI